MNLYGLLTQSATQALTLQKRDGSMSPGYNGPHHDPETPIRNTCHWLITFLKVYEITKDKKFLKASKKCINYILKEKSKYKYNLPHRNIEGKDQCNGLIGPAWTMEALIIASKQLNRKDLSDLASEIFLLHKFDENKGLWHRTEVDGKDLNIDWTFNHQLWFAAIGSMLDKEQYPEVHKQVQTFIDKLDRNFTTYKNGLIWHKVALIPFSIKGLKTILSSIKTKTISKEREIYRAIGYHQFNLYAFGILKENYPSILFWDSQKFKKALTFLKTEEFEKGLEDNKYGFDYNVAGIEIAYVLQEFEENSKDLQKHWLKKQLKRNYDFKKNMLSKNTEDGLTLAARLYEVTRVGDIDLIF
jgi:hypothetical protein